jgi:hypothetical protein
VSEPTDSVSGVRARDRRLWILVAAALALRLAAMFALGTPEKARGDAWDWGHESACLAQSLVDGGPYGDPWDKGTGPSAWLTPPYPALLAVLWKACGGVSPALATTLFAIQSLLSALTCALIVLLGAELGRPRAGWLGGWLFAAYPPAIWNAVDTVWTRRWSRSGSRCSRCCSCARCAPAARGRSRSRARSTARCSSPIRRR